MHTHEYTLSQQGLATIVHRYIFILSVPMVTTEIEFPLELWNSDSLFFDITNKKIKDASAKLESMWSVLCFSCLSRASRTSVIQPLDSDKPGWFWDLQFMAFYCAVQNETISDSRMLRKVTLTLFFLGFIIILDHGKNVLHFHHRYWFW